MLNCTSCGADFTQPESVKISTSHDSNGHYDYEKNDVFQDSKTEIGESVFYECSECGYSIEYEELFRR